MLVAKIQSVPPPEKYSRGDLGISVGDEVCRVRACLLISSEKVGLPIGHPEECGIYPVGGQPPTQFLDVFGVARFQGRFIKHPMLVSWECREKSGLRTPH